MKELLFFNMIFDGQYTELKHTMIIVHVLNTKQKVMHIWIIGKVYTLVFCSIPYSTLEEQIPHISPTKAVQKVMATSSILSVYQHWGFAFVFISNIFVTAYHPVGYFALKWLQIWFVSSTNLKALVKISANSSSCLWSISLHLWIHVTAMFLVTKYVMHTFCSHIR